MPRWICYYHLVWSTRNREPLITRQIERLIYDVIKRKSDEMDSPILVINGVEDHIHIAVMIKPRIAVAEWVKMAKGSSAHEVNRLYPDQSSHFRWQGSYSVQTFGQKNLPFVREYILNQKQHHATNTTIDYLEAIDHDE